MAKRLPTIAMPPMPEYDYDPIPLILSGKKVHTLRKHRCRGRKEITTGGKRTGIILEFTKYKRMRKEQYLDDEFAEADGFAAPDAGKKLGAALCKFYTPPPSRLWCNYFRLLKGNADDCQQ